MSRRIGIGLLAAWSGLVMLAGSGAAAAAPVLEPSPWARAPDGRPMPGQLPARALPALGHRLPPSLAAAQYRWRPIDAARPPPAPRPSWVPAYQPSLPWGRPAVGAGHPRFALPPPRPVGWRAPGPMVVTLDGRPYRFRPVPAWRAPMVAVAPPMQPPVAYPTPRWAPPPVLAAQWPRPLSYLPASAARPAGAPWAQPLTPPVPDGRIAYRFRPDPRFPASVAVPRAAAPWLGQAADAEHAAWLAEDGRHGWEPRLSPAVTPPDRVPYLYN